MTLSEILSSVFHLQLFYFPIPSHSCRQNIATCLRKLSNVRRIEILWPVIPFCKTKNETGTTLETTVHFAKGFRRFHWIESNRVLMLASSLFPLLLHCYTLVSTLERFNLDVVLAVWFIVIVLFPSPPIEIRENLLFPDRAPGSRNGRPISRLWRNRSLEDIERGFRRSEGHRGPNEVLNKAARKREDEI